jgi:uncharacterized protein YunC (DUF1805 family)
MKNIYLLVGSLVFMSSAQAGSFNWDKLKRDRIELQLPLLTIQGEKGWLACGYLNVNACDKTGEACAIVSGVNNHDEMLTKPIQAVSKAASELGVVLGMTGAQALALLR